MHITIQDMAKSFGGVDIISSFSLEVQSGVRLCVCGPNGSGKSTLIKLLAGKETPDQGRVIIPKGSLLGYVEQELDVHSLQTRLLDYVLEVLPDWNSFWEEWKTAIEAEDQGRMASLSARQAELERQYGYNPEHKAKAVLTGLGFSETKWEYTLSQLSGGWRERAKLARVLTAGSDILLLDEPTNHLDLEAVEWLEAFLMDYEGVLVFVAHDRVFMDKVGTHILFCSGGDKPVFRRGSFTLFIALQEELAEQRARAAERLQSEIERKMVFVRRFKAKASKARQAGSHQKMAKRLEKELEGVQAGPKRRELDFKWPVPPQSDRTVLSVADLVFGFADGRRMWDKLTFNIYRGQRIALVGPNGCGKSTLLKLVMARLEKSAGQIVFGQLTRTSYYSQHQLETLNSSGTTLSEIRRLSDPRTTEEELMSVLGLFLLGQTYFDRKVETLSGGEKSRLLLAVLFLARSNFLVLDEPTNHLDLESREALTEALDNFSGTVLLVAHDRHLLSSVADQVWELGPNGFTVYAEGYAEYAEARRARASQQIAAKAGGEGGDGRVGLSREDAKRLKRERAEARNALYREMKPLQDAYAALEKELEALLEAQGQIEALLADQEVYADGARATDLLKSFHTMQAKGDRLLEQLAEAENRLGPLEERRALLQDQ